MTISKKADLAIYVWIWLPGEAEPVVAGKLTKTEGRILFNYGQSYLERDNAIAIYDQELPLKSGIQEKIGLTEGIPGCIRDSSPDSWGRRVILNKLLGLKGKNADPGDLSEMTYLMESGSDRIGALDFQSSAQKYQARFFEKTSLEDLLYSAERVERGLPLLPELEQALNHGTSIGGARPKALIDGKGKKYIAKFSSSTDLYNVIKAEFVAMRLARLCGLNIASVELTNAAGKDVLLVERFDREYKNELWTRKLILSSLTLMSLDEMTARYASYQDFAEIIRHRFTDYKKTLQEMFSRMVFNILVSNTDDHARNHAAFWDGQHLSLTPAYDVCPQLRIGGEASQSMAIAGSDRSSRLITCLVSAQHFLITQEQGIEIIDRQITAIKYHWEDVCQQAKLSHVEKHLFRERLFLNRYIFEGYGSQIP